MDGLELTCWAHTEKPLPEGQALPEGFATTRFRESLELSRKGLYLFQEQMDFLDEFLRGIGAVEIVRVGITAVETVDAVDPTSASESFFRRNWVQDDVTRQLELQWGSGLTRVTMRAYRQVTLTVRESLLECFERMQEIQTLATKFLPLIDF